jgi:methyl-accepting chemotaxis protein
MTGQWTFGKRVGAGFAVTVALSIGIGFVAITALRNVVASKDRVIDVGLERLVGAERLESAIARETAGFRGFLLVRDERFLEALLTAREEATSELQLQRTSVVSGEDRRMVDGIQDLALECRSAMDRLIAMRRTDAPLEEVLKVWDTEVSPKRDQLRSDIQTYSQRQEQLLTEARNAATESANSAITMVSVIIVVIALFATVVAFVLTRMLGRQVGTAVGQVQSSSAELQATANQQATGAKEQATAMNEISTTISELLASSRQIAESAQRVAEIAEQTAGSARTGEGTVEKAHESIAGIRRQVDLVVDHMLELGKKSQQIGAVLEVVSELAEQTNILAINATIEASGAGDAGKRFAVVAEEIRRLADRVAGSTKEIRTLIEDVRSAVNTTVMATETGSKAVDAGSRQFGEVTFAFKQIAALVLTTTEASKEIELSTKQQTSAVEQVNVAITNVAQATRETETGSGQTLQTASQLASLSRELLRLVAAA